MITSSDIMVQLGLEHNLGYENLEWDYTMIPMNEPGNFIVKPDLTKREMLEVFMRTAEPDYNREVTGRVLKIFNNIYTKSKLDKVAETSV